MQKDQIHLYTEYRKILQKVIITKDLKEKVSCHITLDDIIFEKRVANPLKPLADACKRNNLQICDVYMIKFQRWKCKATSMANI